MHKMPGQLPGFLFLPQLNTAKRLLLTLAVVQCGIRNTWNSTMENKSIYLVGGAVRDTLLGVAPKDKDYVVVGSTPQDMLLRGFLSVGKDFPVFLHPDTKEEYALARTERKRGHGYAGFAVHTSADVTLEDDLARRDLTINAMAISLDGELFDPFDGQSDLANKIIRHTTAAFSEDPVRVLRVARFMARFGDEWTIHPDTLTLMKQVHASGELSYLTAERVWKETEKALGEPHPHLYFETLLGFGLFPEIESMVGVPQPPQYHPEGDVFVHTMLALKRAAELQCDVETRFAVLCHDFGKAPTFAAFGNLHGHEQAGAPVIDAFCDRYRIPNLFRQLAKLSSVHHTRCHKMFEMTPRRVHSLIVEDLAAHKHPARFEQFLLSCMCDAQGRGETLREVEYKQAEAARQYLAAVLQVDTKYVAQRAMAKGKKGQDVGLLIREAQIQAIRDAIPAA